MSAGLENLNLLSRCADPSEKGNLRLLQSIYCILAGFRTRLQLLQQLCCAVQGYTNETDILARPSRAKGTDICLFFRLTKTLIQSTTIAWYTLQCSRCNALPKGPRTGPQGLPQGPGACHRAPGPATGPRCHITAEHTVFAASRVTLVINHFYP